MTEKTESTNGQTVIGQEGTCDVFAHLQNKRIMSGKQDRTSLSLLDERKYSIKDAVKMLGIGVTTMRRIITAGEVPVIRLHGKILILERDLQELLTKHYGRLKSSANKPVRSHLPPLPKEVRESPYLQRKAG